MSGTYEVLSPWAATEPIPLKGLAPRLPDLKGRKIGLFSLTFKKASTPILSSVEAQLRIKFPGTEFLWFENPYSLIVADKEYYSETFFIPQQMKDNFDKWVKEVDAVIGAVGD